MADCNFQTENIKSFTSPLRQNHCYECAKDCDKYAGWDWTTGIAVGTSHYHTFYYPVLN